MILYCYSRGSLRANVQKRPRNDKMKPPVAMAEAETGNFL